MKKGLVHVAAAAIVNQRNEVLISRRADHVHQGGLWEFPGGKLENSETVERALVRELAEELGIRLKSYRPLIRFTHHYEDKSVLLDVWKVNDYSGEPEGKEGQLIRWQAIDRLDPSEFPAADVPVIQALSLPEHYMITGAFSDEKEFEQRLESALDRGIKLVQLRLKSDWLQAGNETLAKNVAGIARSLCKQAGATLMFNMPDELSNTRDRDFLHIDSKKLRGLTIRPDCELLSASCHNLEEINKALELEADFMVLSPVQLTSSHPEADPLGWEKFGEIVSNINVPVYALGGVNEKHTEQAWRAGAQGVAAISAFWNRESQTNI